MNDRDDNDKELEARTAAREEIVRLALETHSLFCEHSLQCAAIASEDELRAHFKRLECGFIGASDRMRHFAIATVRANPDFLLDMQKFLRSFQEWFRRYFELLPAAVGPQEGAQAELSEHCAGMENHLRGSFLR